MMSVSRVSGLQSMTGYGAAETQGLKVEIRSLNHRHADITLRAPSLFAAHEVPIRARVKERFSRGKFDVTVSVTAAQKVQVRLNMHVARALHEAFLDLQRELGMGGGPTLEIFSGYRDLLMTQEQEVSETTLMEVVEEALDRLEEMRRREGTLLSHDLGYRLARLEELHREVALRAGELSACYRDAITKRVADLMAELPVDEVRVAQEIAIAAQRMDISEELARLKSHLEQCRSLVSAGGVVGRRLDFLVQELHRETNTISSKAADLGIINAAVDMKTEIERLREQVQNIE
jgi:uncharacterized protein (TIGR00255 family)